jgi:hypothetical protein
MIDVKTNKIVYKNVFGNGQRIHTFAIAPDKSVWVNHAYLHINQTKFIKFIFNTTASEITATVSDLTIMKNPDQFEGPQPNGLYFVQASTNSYDLYISGFRSLCRISSACNVI